MLNYSLSAAKARSSSWWGSSFLPWSLLLLAANMTAVSADREPERRTLNNVRAPDWQRLSPMEERERTATSDGACAYGIPRSKLVVTGVPFHQWAERGGRGSPLAATWKRGEVKWRWWCVGQDGALIHWCHPGKKASRGSASDVIVTTEQLWLFKCHIYFIL